MTGKASVAVLGRRAPLLGAISMDMIVVDLTAIPDAREGDEVVLLGGTIPAEEWCRWLDTIPYEVFCNISGRVPRVYR